ncbi:leucyl aminopeptidase [Erythrobacteraceae bacterium CFH 75059]|uniref:leucyl aminopeptidase n=1 Tax=Qipengyuania thermophila TaxID=2509361 RepID=UPI00102029C2|nr:leucyl aminopeptidase [Qipengyuania thermophila]TCD06340.1 leucyl aminopeptidase [Erythrobacteraceae bacterium CFH 75059]
MDFHFTADLPSGARLVAYPVRQGKLPDTIGRVSREGAAASRFDGAAGQVFAGFEEVEGEVRQIALAGLGAEGSEPEAVAAEKAGGALCARYLCSGQTELALDLRDSGLGAEEAAALLLGLRLRAWRLDTYRTRLKDEARPTLDHITVVGAPSGTEDAWTRAAAVAQGVEFARELVAEPANVIYPESFVERCRDRFEGTGVQLTVLDDEQMRMLGMGALLGVGQGSARASRLLAVRWDGGAADAAPTALVGKGVTFDTGGISIKPGAGMEDMKWDMGGAAAVVGAMLTLALRKARANVVGVVGLVENMPDGKAQRPGDVVTSMNGQTIEVINTDAEGRLVLADVMHWTQTEFKPARMVDFATLTGAMIIALGHEHGGLFSNDDTLAQQLLAAGSASGDKLWRFPLSPAYDKLIDSPIADIKNVGPRQAGSITAAQFLQRFVLNGTPWAHCDIAGMVWADKPGATYDKGATGYGVRLIDRFIADTGEG